jgi:ATP-dependent helicase HrpB
MKNEKLLLPIDTHLGDIVKQAEAHPVLLVKSSPGSGKTTRLPWAIARQTGKNVIVLEPRRLAAKLAAERISAEEDLKLGEEVGYHFRFDKRLSSKTKLLFYTEGTFLRRLFQDPDLKEISYVVLDEFHERHIETDISLAYLKSLQQKRKDLKLILMSATLDTKLTEYFEDTSIFELDSPLYPVKVHYLPNVPSELNRPLEAKIKEALRQVSTSGDILIFLPGMREMLRVKSYLEREFDHIYLLHGELSKEEQDQALSTSDERKIVLATNVAESSITLPGVTTVIDSGIQREAHYSSWHGLKLISDFPTTQSSSIQRTGRAGRVAPGECFRLFSQQDFLSREQFTIPEILRADLTDVYLLSLKLTLKLSWLMDPPSENWKKARDLCYQLGAINKEGFLSDVGEKILSYPLGARLSRILIAGEFLRSTLKKGLLRYISEVIEKDHFGVLQRRLNSYLQLPGDENQPIERILLHGFVDQLAKYRSSHHDFIHYSGRTFRAHPSLHNLSEGYYLILDISQRQEAMLVAEIEEAWLYELNPFPFQEEEDIEVGEKIVVKNSTKIGSILLEEVHRRVNFPDLSPALKTKLLSQGQKFFDKVMERWRSSDYFSRALIWAKLHNQSIDPGMFSLENYFIEYLELNWDFLETYLDNKLAEIISPSSLNESFPLKVKLAGNKEVMIHYTQESGPYIEAYIQDFYGVAQTPLIGKGQITLTLRILGPHKRPIQVTKDLEGFWQKTYLEMKKELQREYPRHHWPEDPRTAKPVLLKSHLNRP